MKQTVNILVLMLLSLGMVNSYASEIDWQILPKEAVKNKPFSLVFKIKTSLSQDPEIYFEQSSFDIVDLQITGPKIKTIFQGGRIKTLSEYLVVYRLLTDKAGTSYLRDVSLTIGNEVTKLRNIKISVRSAPARAKDFFLETEISKTSIFLGEPIVVHYYLYNRLKVLGKDIKTFPKLRNFTRRYIQPLKVAERITLNNHTYEKYSVYTVVLFPEKEGKISIDPLNLRLQVKRSRRRNSYGYGVRKNRTEVKQLRSKQRYVEVKPLPAPMPSNFSGLVGKHSFRFLMNRTKFSINEVIEAKLIVKGEGALENFDAPKLYTDVNLEGFETTGELKVSGVDGATKIFGYTFIGRGDLTAPQTKHVFSYFDPVAEKYIEREVLMPSLVVNKNFKQGKPNGLRKKKGVVVKSQIKEKTLVEKDTTGIIAPLFSYGAWRWQWLKIFNILLGIIALFGLLSVLRKAMSKKAKTEQGNQWIKLIHKEGINYSRIHHLLIGLDKDDGRVKNMDLGHVIDESQLSDGAKSYFKELLEKCVQAQYKGSEDKIDFVTEQEYFNELEKYLAKG